MVKDKSKSEEKQERAKDCIERLAQEDDDVITLKTSGGEDVDFFVIAAISLEGMFYAVVQPVELFDGMGPNDALVFAVEEGADGQDLFKLVTDDATIDAVFAEYNKQLDEAENGE